MKQGTRKQISTLAELYCVTKGKKFRLKEFDAGNTDGLEAELKQEAKALLAIASKDDLTAVGSYVAPVEID